VVQRSREEIHQAAHDLFLRVGTRLRFASHYRYFTGFSEQLLRLPATPAVQRLGLRGPLGRLWLRLRIVLRQPPRRIVVEVEAELPLTLPELLSAATRQPPSTH